MNYQETLDYLFSSLPMYQRQGAAAYKENLDNTLALDEYFQKPHQRFKSIHVAGTNGKGSVSHMLAAVLSKAGYQTGLYTSPHLIDFRERIRINGEMISEKEVIDFVENHHKILEKLRPSFFEMSVAMAFNYFGKQKTNIAVIETGMGGRLDSTNIIHPVLSVITNIGFDHTRFLGNTLPEIAGEKAGIIKPGVPVVVGERQEETHEVFERIAAVNSSELIYSSDHYRVERAMMNMARKRILQVSKKGEIKYKNLISDLLGGYQDKNVPTLLQSIEVLKKQNIKIKDNHVYEGLAHVKELTGIRGRWEEIGYNPLIICDTAHNAEGVREIVKQLENTPRKKLHIVWGMVSDKDPLPILSQLPKDAIYYFCKADIPRAREASNLQAIAATFGLEGMHYENVSSAFAASRRHADQEDLIFIGGSTFVVAEVLSLYPKPSTP